MTALFTRMALIGCGLIGGSLALAVKKTGLVDEIVGTDNNPDVLQVALSRGMIDRIANNLQTCVSGADLVVLAVPVPIMPTILKQLANYEEIMGISPLITDVGGTKQEVVDFAHYILKKAEFIGGHPMAGSEKSGIHAAHDRLLENAVYVLTPGPKTSQDTVDRFSSLLRSAGARPKIMDPRHHDEVVAAISHVPHLIAAALVNQVSELAEKDNSYRELAAGGFRDITRIASSDPLLWRDLSLGNKSKILPLIAGWIEQLTLLSQWLVNHRESPLEQFFLQARSFRDSLPAKASGGFPALYSMTVQVPDEPGIIGVIASLLGHHHISIRNIGILESREDEDGQLILQFDRFQDLDAAKIVLEENSYPVFQRV